MTKATWHEQPESYLAEQGYSFVRKLPTGEWAGLQRMVFTTGLFIGLDEFGWRTRFCFEDSGQAMAALAVWNGEGFPPGYWIKQKPEEVMNPLREAQGQ